MIVLSALSLTTVPCRTRLGIAAPSTCRLALGARLADDGLDPRDVAPHLADPGGVLELPGRPLKAKVELLLLQLQQLLRQLIPGLAPQLHRLHRPPSSPTRATNRVCSGSLAAPRRIASAASGPGTPSISNMIRPALTGATQYSTEPLPLPMRTSAGFLLTGMSGKMRIQTRPARLR